VVPGAVPKAYHLGFDIVTFVNLNGGLHRVNIVRLQGSFKAVRIAQQKVEFGEFGQTVYGFVAFLGRCE
jgi:hypothetical protein